jgi:hypothetical protein
MASGKPSAGGTTDAAEAGGELVGLRVAGITEPPFQARGFSRPTTQRPLSPVWTCGQ